MSIYWGNKDSDIICIFFHGWTATTFDTFEYLKDSLDENLYWILPETLSKSNEWFRYGKYTTNNGNDYDSIMINNNLNINNNSEFKKSLNYIDEIVEKIPVHKSIVMMGTSQGATIAFHYVHSYMCKKNIVGGWFHNMAGFYPEFLETNEKYVYSVYNDINMKDGDRHSTFDDDTFNSMQRSLNTFKRHKKRRIFFYNSLNDYVIPNILKKRMFDKLFQIYDCCV